MNLRKVIHHKSLLITICIILIFSKNVSAYINPASLTVLFQVILVVIVGGIFTFRQKVSLLFKKLVSLIKRKKPPVF